MPSVTVPACPSCRADWPQRFPLRRQLVFLCKACGFVWSPSDALIERAFAAPDEPEGSDVGLYAARTRLKSALLRFLRPTPVRAELPGRGAQRKA
jgi:hypothetical protein